MTRTLLSSALAAVAVTVWAAPFAATPPPQDRAGMGGFGVPVTHDVPDDYARRLAPRLTGIPPRTPPSFPFYPQAGTLWQDLVTSNFVDVGDGTTPASFDCARRTYLGHNGHDSVLAGFREQALGFPVFAALDGTVSATRDGEDDQQTTNDTTRPANFVALDHGDGTVTRYLHLRKGSVAVSPGQAVTAGTQLGLTASSGNSSWPHLHFDAQIDGVFYEPSAGSCRAGDSYWTRQDDGPASPVATHLAFSESSFEGSSGYPFDNATRTGTFLTGFRSSYFRLRLTHVPAGATYRARYIRPNGSVAVDFSNPFGHSSAVYGPWYWFFVSTTFDTTGTWRLEFSVNGSVVIDAPFRVVSSSAGNTNRPPNAITAALEPASPRPTDVPFCRVSTSLVSRDPDYDLLTYRYEWKLDGAVVRDVTTGALSDAVPRGLLKTGSTLSCSVTASDGQLSSSPATVSSVIGGTTMTVDRASLRFAARRTVSSFSSYTPAQTVQILRTGSDTVTWSAVANQPWITLSLSSASGTNSGQIRVAVQPADGLPASGTVTGSVTITYSGATTVSSTVAVTLDLVSTSTSPFGQVDTPSQNASGVVGAIGVTGWAMDDVAVAGVGIYRNCLPFDNPASCQTILGHSVVFIGHAAFLSGARPDVEAAFPSSPQAYRAGWGYLMLTPMLPNVTAQQAYGGVGALTLYAFATDVEGNVTLLGRSQADQTPTSITMANDTIAKPFGAIDTPGQGDTVSGTLHNFGWALTPDSDTTAGNSDILIPTNGSTMFVFIDGAPVAAVAYNQCRGTVGNPVPSASYCNDDVANIFGNLAPAAPNTARAANPTRHRNLDAGRAAIGVHSIDTTKLANGLHTIAWSVTDSAGRTEGIGSRFFNVLNSASDLEVAAREIQSHTPVVHGRIAAAEAGSPGPGGVEGRIGFDLTAPFTRLQPGDDGVYHVEMPALGRLELRVPGAGSAHLVVNGELRDLPAGASLRDGTFAWIPPAGYVGSYEIRFGGGGTVVIAVGR